MSALLTEYTELWKRLWTLRSKAGSWSVPGEEADQLAEEMATLYGRLSDEERQVVEEGSCSTSGHVTPFKSLGCPRFTCLRCDGVFDLDPLSRDIFVIPGK